LYARERVLQRDPARFDGLADAIVADLHQAREILRLQPA
jgi:hypothetical protein